MFLGFRKSRYRTDISKYFKKQQKYAPLYSLIGTGHREISCRLTDRVFDNISGNLQKLDSLGNELRDGSTGTFIMFQLRPKALSWNRSANLRGKSYSIFPVACSTYPLANPSARFGEANGQHFSSLLTYGLSRRRGTLNIFQLEFTLRG